MLRLSARCRRQAIKIGSVLVLLLAVMPQVLYLGHPGAREDKSVQRSIPHHEHHEKTETEHANHCHVGPKGCAAADGAVHVASFDVAVQTPDDGAAPALIEHAPLARGFALWQRPEKPPQPI